MKRAAPNRSAEGSSERSSGGYNRSSGGSGSENLDREAQNRSRSDFSSQRFQNFQRGVVVVDLAAVIVLAVADSAAVIDLGVEGSVAEAALVDSAVAAGSEAGAENKCLESYYLIFINSHANKTRKGKDMTKLSTLTSIAGVGAVLTLMAACQTVATNDAELAASKKEFLLAQSGFKVITVTTAKQQQAISGLAQIQGLGRRNTTANCTMYFRLRPRTRFMSGNKNSTTSTKGRSRRGWQATQRPSRLNPGSS